MSFAKFYNKAVCNKKLKNQINFGELIVKL